jgi:hypothetical protein
MPGPSPTLSTTPPQSMYATTATTTSTTPLAPPSSTMTPLPPPNPETTRSSARPLLEMWKKQRPISLATTPLDSVSTVPEDPPLPTTPFWKTVVEGWRQDQLAWDRSTWDVRHTYYLQRLVPPTLPSSYWAANTVGANTVTLTYSAANVRPPSTTATATYRCFHLESSQASTTMTSNSSHLSLTPMPIRANDPSRGMSSTTSQKMVKKPKFPPLKPKKKCHPSSGWRYVTAEEWAWRQMREEEFSIIATGQTHLGPHSARHITPYPQLPRALTATRDTTTSHSESPPLVLP